MNVVQSGIQASDYFLLFLNETRENKGYQYIDKKIYMGLYTFYLYDKLLETKNCELEIFPQYFSYGGHYSRIFEINSFYSLQDANDALIVLLSDTKIEIKCIIETIHSYDFEKEIELSLRILSSQNTMNSPYIRLVNKEKITLLEQFITKHSVQQTEFRKVSIFCKVEAESVEKLKKHVDFVKKRMRVFHAKIDDYFFKQLQGIETFYLQKTLRMGQEQTFYMNRSKIEVVFPKASIGLFDKDGLHLGYDARNNPVFFDIWKKDLQRSNSNFIVLGQSGQGKTTCMQSILYGEKKSRQIIVDPENEYDFSYVSDDEYQKVTINQNHCIVTLMDLQKLRHEEIDYLVEHFARRTSANYVEQQHYRNILIDAKTCGVGSFDEVYRRLKHEEIPQIIFLYLKELTYKKQVQLSFEKRVTHIVMNEQLESGSLQTSLFLFELLFHIWSDVRRQREERTLVLLDEGYIFFQKNASFLVNLLRNMYKRIRKYEGSIGLITQNMADFMEKETKYMLMPIIDNATYKFIFQQGDIDYQLLLSFLRIRTSEKEQMEACMRGECFLVVGRQGGKVRIKQYV